MLTALCFDTYHRAKNLPYSEHIYNFNCKSDKLLSWQDNDAFNSAIKKAGPRLTLPTFLVLD